MNKKGVFIASREDIQNHDIANPLMLAVQDYVKAAFDFPTNAGETWRVIKESVEQGDLDSLLILHAPDGILNGFMYCRIAEEDPDCAVIHSAYSRAQVSTEALNLSLSLFEDWAKFKAAKHARFYTFRVPGAHVRMMKRGWKHVLTSYRKEI